MNLQRYDDWPTRLSAHVDRHRYMAYRLGTNDCGSFFLDAVKAMTGVDLLPGVARPSSWIGAARFMLARKYESVEDLVTEVLGSHLPAAHLARHGDVISFSKWDDVHLAICIGTAAATPDVKGLTFVERQDWCKAWKV